MKEHIRIVKRRFTIEIQAPKQVDLLGFEIDNLYSCIYKEYDKDKYQAFTARWHMLNDIKAYRIHQDLRTPKYYYKLCSLRINSPLKTLLQEMAKKDGGLKVSN